MQQWAVYLKYFCFFNVGVGCWTLPLGSAFAASHKAWNLMSTYICLRIFSSFALELLLDPLAVQQWVVEFLCICIVLEDFLVIDFQFVAV